MKPTLNELENITRQAGEILRAGFGRSNNVYHKSEIDLVTDIDHRAEAFIIGEIKRRFPSDRIIAEESGDLPGQDTGVWYIDPLDGTVNYAHGVPIFAVSIGYVQEGRLSLGAIYDPMLDEYFCAQAGKGAWLNGEPIKVSNTQNLDQSLLVTGFPYDIRTNPDNNLDLYERFSLRAQGVRRLGSAALDLCYVASGRLDGFWELRLGPWDSAAGGLIALEAGATVTDISGEPDFLAPPCSILAANPKIHTQMLETICRSS